MIEKLLLQLQCIKSFLLLVKFDAICFVDRNFVQLVTKNFQIGGHFR